MAFTQEWRIDCPPATVFDLMMDLRNVPRWNDSCSRAELLSDEPVRHGSRFHMVFQGERENDVTITGLERPRTIEFAGTSKPMDILTTYELIAVDDGVRLRGTFDPTPKGAMKLLLPLLMPMIRRDLAKHHAKFKSLCEAQPRSAQLHET